MVLSTTWSEQRFVYPRRLWLRFTYYTQTTPQEILYTSSASSKQTKHSLTCFASTFAIRQIRTTENHTLDPPEGGEVPQQSHGIYYIIYECKKYVILCVFHHRKRTTCTDRGRGEGKFDVTAEEDMRSIQKSVLCEEHGRGTFMANYYVPRMLNQKLSKKEKKSTINQKYTCTHSIKYAQNSRLHKHTTCAF